MPFVTEITIGGAIAAFGALWKMHSNQVNTKIKHEQRIATIEADNKLQELKIVNLESKNGSIEKRLDRLDDSVNEIKQNITKILTILEGGSHGKKHKNLDQ